MILRTYDIPMLCCLCRLKQCQLEKTSGNEAVRKLGQQLADRDAKRHVKLSFITHTIFVVYELVLAAS